MARASKETVAWGRQPEEAAIHYEAFECYRDMPHPRSIRRACKEWLQQAADSDAPVGGQQERYRRATVIGPKEARRYLDQTSRRWRSWSSRYRWLERVRLYDEHLEYVKLKARNEAQEQKAKDQVEEEQRQQSLLLYEARGLRSAARRLLRRILDALEAEGALDVLSLIRQKEVNVTRKGPKDDQTIDTAESVRPSLLELLPLVESGLATGARLERFAKGDVQEVPEGEVSPTDELERLLIEGIRQASPEELAEAQQILQVMREGRIADEDE